MTPEQREAAVKTVKGAVGDWLDPISALESAGFVVLHRDDVTEERAWSPHEVAPTPDHARLVTRWEPIAKEDTDA